jgi:general stress protein 26
MRMNVSIVLLVTLLIGMPGEDASMQADPTQEQILSAARQIMTSAHYCTLITLDEGGHPQARIMDAFEPDPDLTVWLGTNAITRKVAELRRDPRMTLSYFDRDDPGYVTLLGEARLVTDPDEKAARWKEEWEAFYPDGPSSEDYMLIEFRPFRIEVMSIKHAIASDPQGWKPATVELSSR